MSYKNTRNKYFKEYEGELIGKHSPGPCQYNTTISNFNISKALTKSLPREKRVCPIVNRVGSNERIGPNTYQIDYKTLYEKKQISH